MAKKSRRKKATGRTAEVMRPSGLTRISPGRIGGEAAPNVLPHGAPLVRDSRRATIVLGRPKRDETPDLIA